MSKVINLEIVDILEGIAVLETERGFEIEIDLESLPLNIKVGQVIKCAMSLHINAHVKEGIVNDTPKKTVYTRLPLLQ